MAKESFNPMEMKPRSCMQDPGFLDDPHARWAVVMFVATAGRATFAVESVQRYAGLAQKKKKASFVTGAYHPDPEYLQ